MASCGLPALWVQWPLFLQPFLTPPAEACPVRTPAGTPASHSVRRRGPAAAPGPQSSPALALSPSSLSPSSCSVLSLRDPASVPQRLSSEVPAWQCRHAGAIPGSGRSPGEGNGNPFQYSCLGNSTDRGAWWAAVHGVARVGHD